MADFEHFWACQRHALRACGWSEDAIDHHQTTALLAWVTADSTRGEQ